MKTQQQLLTSLFLFFGIVGPSFAQNRYCDAKFEILKREKKDKYSFVKENLQDLYCGEVFEGKSFKIVHGTSETPISFYDQDPMLVKKAANVYFHLSKAKNFWINEIKSQYVSEMEQITIRLDITNGYSDKRQFLNSKQQEGFNNAWTLPEGETPRFVKDKKSWGKEIWFNPMKKIDSRKEVRTTGANPIHQSFELIKDPINDLNKNGLLYQGLSYIANPTFTDTNSMLSLAIQRVGSIAVVYGLSEVTKHMDKWFVDKYLFVETAMIPDIIYHEFAHIALSDSMKTLHSVPVIEGMADYFATRIDQRAKMFQKIEKFSSNRHKALKNNKYYHPVYEESWKANSDFVLSLLWKVRTRLEEENEKRIKKGQKKLVDIDQLIHSTHYDLTEQSDISNDLSRELMNNCSKLCTNKRLGIDTIRAAFADKGLL